MFPDDHSPENLTFTDEDLLSRFLEGETKAFDLLYERYLPRLNARVSTRFNRAEDIEDLVGEIWASALKNIRKFDPNKSKFSTWFYTIANRRINDELRDRYKKPPTVTLIPEASATSDDIVEMMQETEEPSPNPVLQFIDSQKAIELNEIKEKIIASLDKPDKLLYQLKFEQQLSYEEIQSRWTSGKKLDIHALEEKVCRLRKKINSKIKEYLYE